MDKPLITRATFQFSQDGNTLGTTSDYEQLDVYLETQCAERGAKPFIVIETHGWSISDAEDLNTLINSCVDAFMLINK